MSSFRTLTRTELAGISTIMHVLYAERTIDKLDAAVMVDLLRNVFEHAPTVDPEVEAPTIPLFEARSFGLLQRVIADFAARPLDWMRDSAQRLDAFLKDNLNEVPHV